MIVTFYPTDIQAPQIIDCPGDKTVLAEVDENSAEVSWWNPTIVDNSDPKYILTEYASKGDLKNYLISLDLLDTETETLLIKVARDIAKALSFMSMKGVMHKDIAARNVFLTKHFTAKIGDFGLGRDVYERPASDYQPLLWANQHDRFPLRWMPPEFLKDGTFSLKSDIWSYGILLWEIGSLGGYPLMGVENLLEYLQGGGRPVKPDGCTHPAGFSQKPSKRNTGIQPMAKLVFDLHDYSLRLENQYLKEIVPYLNVRLPQDPC
ncbi:insulin-like growth factor 1 receptor [Ptychodera flava]|uniref:insulin-like growth factor 1 receptor n=1 Tax=Ptychodera flava TaxID=63121 RepID=UPI003969D1E9